MPGRRSLSRTISALAAALTLLIAGVPGLVYASPFSISPRLGPPGTEAVEAEDFEESDLDPETLRLKEAYDEAHVAFLSGRFLDAGAKFDEGYAQSGLVPFLFNAAVAWERAGKLEQAAERYAEYLVKDPSAPDHDEIKERLEAIREALAANQTEVKAKQIGTKAITVIETKPAKAEIRLDDPNGPIFAIAPYRGVLPPGEHTVYVRAKGYKQEFKEVPNIEGEFRLMYFSLSEEYFLGHLELASNVAGADVYLKQITDDKGAAVEHQGDADVAVGQTPFSNQIPPGKWEVRVKKLGYKDYRAEIDLPQGKVITHDVNLELLPHAFLDLKAETPESIGAIAYLGEQAKEELCTLPCQAQIEPGEHTVTIKKDKKKTLVFEVAVAKSDLVTVRVRMEPYTPRYPAIITGVLMAGAAGAGTFFALEAKRIREDLEEDIDNFAQVEEDDPRAQRGKVNAIVADSLFGATAILGALTLFYLLREKGEPSQGEKEQKNLAVTPVFGPNGGGVSAAVRF